MISYKHISLQERDEIAKLNAQGFSTHSIAERLGRSQPTISRELKRCSLLGRDYASSAAQVDRNIKASKKGRKKKLIEGNKLHSQVESLLINEKWSPEQISGYFKLHFNSTEYNISYESIYKYIYSIKAKEDREKWIRALRQKKKKRYRRKANRLRTGKIPNRTSIHERPSEIESRTEGGHWEGDLIIGKNHGSAIGTMVERTSRFVKIVPLNEGKTSRIVVGRFNEELTDIPNFLKISLTYDNGTEFTEHEYFTHESGMKVYFADPGCPGQRGTNENTNGLIREFFPKKTDFNGIQASEIKEVERLLNRRPRKILGYRTPEEVMEGMLTGGWDPPKNQIISGEKEQR